MRHDVWDMRHETWDIWNKTHDIIRYDTWHSRHETWDIRHGILVSCMWCMIYYTWEVGCGMWIWHATCNMWIVDFFMWHLGLGMYDGAYRVQHVEYHMSHVVHDKGPRSTTHVANHLPWENITPRSACILYTMLFWCYECQNIRFNIWQCLRNCC